MEVDEDKVSLTFGHAESKVSEGRNELPHFLSIRLERPLNVFFVIDCREGSDLRQRVDIEGLASPIQVIDELWLPGGITDSQSRQPVAFRERSRHQQPLTPAQIVETIWIIVCIDIFEIRRNLVAVPVAGRYIVVLDRQHGEPEVGDQRERVVEVVAQVLSRDQPGPTVLAWPFVVDLLRVTLESIAFGQAEGNQHCVVWSNGDTEHDVNGLGVTVAADDRFVPVVGDITPVGVGEVIVLKGAQRIALKDVQWGENERMQPAFGIDHDIAGTGGRPYRPGLPFTVALLLVENELRLGVGVAVVFDHKHKHSIADAGDLALVVTPPSAIRAVSQGSVL